jgi:plastocyanin
MKALLVWPLLPLFTLFASPEALPQGGGVEGTITTEAKVATKGATSQRDVVLWLVPKGEAPAAKPATVRVSQKKLNFEPHVLPIVRGSTVEFANEDQVKHNVFVDSECCKLDADTDKGETKSHVFDKAGEYPIVCRLHPEMSMVVVVLDTPHFVRVELQKDKERSVDGKTVHTVAFKLEGVPPGTYTLRTWNKKLKPIEREVTIADGKLERVDLTLDK